jgi:hypothetical protein
VVGHADISSFVTVNLHRQLFYARNPRKGPVWTATGFRKRFSRMQRPRQRVKAKGKAGALYGRGFRENQDAVSNERSAQGKHLRIFRTAGTLGSAWAGPAQMHLGKMTPATENHYERSSSGPWPSLPKCHARRYGLRLATSFRLGKNYASGTKAKNWRKPSQV